MSLRTSFETYDRCIKSPMSRLRKPYGAGSFASGGGEEPRVRTYLERLGGDKLVKWCIAHHVRIFTASMTTTGRSESLNRVCKMFLNKRTTLVKVMEELLARASYEATVRVQNRVHCETSWAEYGRTSRSAFPSVYDEAYDYLTPYAMRLLSKQAVRCAIYDVEAGTHQALQSSAKGDVLLTSLRLYSEAPLSDRDEDVVDPPSIVAAARFVSDHNLHEGNSAVLIVKAQVATETKGAPQTVVLYNPDENSGIHRAFYCTCGFSARAGVPCRHFLAVVRSPSSKAGFHLGLCNELWFKKPCEEAKVVHYHVAGSAPILATAPVHISPLQALVPGCEPLQAEGLDLEKARKLSDARCISILLGESKNAVQAAMDHGKFAQFREYLGAWNYD